MRRFNKIFIIALPRCATVSMSHAVGMMGVKIAHLGRIYGEPGTGHSNPNRLKRMFDQIAANNFELDILQLCQGLADYPVCCMPVVERLDRHYPGSLFINVRRDASALRWLQSVERQFVGLQLLNRSKPENSDSQNFLELMLKFREMTFGQREFQAEVYQRAYAAYQHQIQAHFSRRSDALLEFSDIAELDVCGFERLAEFLQAISIAKPFPRSDDHSRLPAAAFDSALAAGEIFSQTGNAPVAKVPS